MAQTGDSQDSTDAPNEWRYETLSRYGGTVFMVYLDETIRGSLMLYEQWEIEAWQKVIVILNLKEKSPYEIRQ